jgi:hypothetical protein
MCPECYGWCFRKFLQVLQVEKELFCPLPCSVAGHPIRIVNVPHVTVIIPHSCRLYRVPLFIAVIAFSGWNVKVCQEVHFSLVLPHHSRQVTPCPYSNVTTFQSVLVLRSLGMPFLCNLTVPQQKNFSAPSRHTGHGRKKSCSSTVYGQNHRQDCGCWPATLPTSSSSSELLAEKCGLAGCDTEDRREGGCGPCSSSVPSEA